MNEAVPDEPAPKLKPHEGLKRRRRWIGSGWTPLDIASGFTAGENAVLAVIASEVMVRGWCDLGQSDLAERAGVSPGMVRKAIRQAEMLRLIGVEDERIRIASRPWLTWIEARRPDAPPSPEAEPETEPETETETDMP